MPTNRITAIINAERSITTDTALRLGKFFGTTPDFWLNLQLRYDLRVAVMAVLAGCGGGVQTYWSNDDAGHCVEHASQQYCHVSTGPCDDSGPPDSDLLATAIVVCTP